MFSIIKKYRFALFTFVLTFVLTMAAFGFFIKRNSFISEIKKQITRSTELLNAQGIDVSYENLSFSRVPFAPIMSVENFRVYDVYDVAKFDWNLGNVTIKDNFFNFGKLSLFPAQKETITINNHKYDFGVNEFRIVEEHDEKNINKLSFELKNVTVGNLFDAEEINLKLKIPEQGRITSQNSIEFKQVQISDNVQTPLLRKIDRILLKFSTLGTIKSEDTSDNIWGKWIANNGSANIDKLIIRWEPLVLVGKGNLTFDSNKESNIKLNTTSKGLLETLEMLNEQKTIDSASYYVVKLLIENKAYKLKEEDDYKTSTTSVMIKGSKVLLENVPIYDMLQK
ncbi:MAG: DUF2125 domain-containing protein [Alphaproteobacteria bacterium]